MCAFERFDLSGLSFPTVSPAPDIVVRPLRAPGREPGVRIRHANMTIQQLEA